MMIMVKNDRITIMVDRRVVRHAVDDLRDVRVIYCLPFPI